MRILKVILVYLAVILLAEASIRIFFPEYRALHHATKITGGIPFSLNSLGLRDHEFYPSVKYRHIILCLGDSITFGTQNRLEDIYPKVLERLLNERGTGNVRVINAGGLGGNPVMEFEYLKDKGIDLKPDYVIVGICLNDVGDCYTSYVGNEKEGLAKTPNFWRNSDDFRVYKNAWKWNKDLPFILNVKIQLNKFRWFLRSKSYLYSFTDVALLKFMYRTGIKKYSFDMYGERGQLLSFGIDKTSEKGWEVLFESLRQMKDFLADRKIGFLVVIFPFEFQLSDEHKDNFFNIDKRTFTIDPQKKLLDFGKNNNIKMIDLLPYFKKSGKKIYYPLDYCHPNATGHAIAAEEIYDAIKDDLK